MDEPVFVARLFRDDKNPKILALRIFLFLVILVSLGAIAISDNRTIQWIAGGVLLAALIAIAFSGKIALNQPDDKNIYISREGVAVGNERFDWPVLEDLGIYVEAYYGFKSTWRSDPNADSSYGMDNRIYFRVGDQKHEYQFFIPNHEAYFLLEDILATWRSDGRRFAWKEAYGREYIERIWRAQG